MPAFTLYGSTREMVIFPISTRGSGTARYESGNGDDGAAQVQRWTGRMGKKSVSPLRKIVSNPRVVSNANRPFATTLAFEKRWTWALSMPARRHGKFSGPREDGQR